MQFFRPILICALVALTKLGAQTPNPVLPPTSPEKVIIDTDIGDDLDDAFAVALALKSPELEIVGISTTFGDTKSRARLLDRLLGETGHSDIPVAEGIAGAFHPLSQQRYAEGGHFAKDSHPGAVEFVLDQIRRYPHQITLVAIGPLVNIGTLIEKDPETFGKLKRAVVMGGSVYLGYGDLGYSAPHGPDAEYNIASDIPSAQKLFHSRVPIFMMPIDSTQLKLDEVKRSFLFREGTPITDALSLLYHQWNGVTPTLFDPMAIAYIVNPSLAQLRSCTLTLTTKDLLVLRKAFPTLRFASIQTLKNSFAFI
jgi:inosine-uridine nucleoside N-ribohydrolase